MWQEKRVRVHVVWGQGRPLHLRRAAVSCLRPEGPWEPQWPSAAWRILTQMELSGGG